MQQAYEKVPKQEEFSLDVEQEKLEKMESLPPPPPSASSVVFWFATNISTSVGIVMVNKWIFEHHNFKFGTTLAFFHFATMFIVLELGAHFNFFKVQTRHVQVSKIALLAATFISFVVLTNLSLRYNSVGIYQCAKILSTPVTALLQFVHYGQKVSRIVLLALSIVCIGVFIATVTDLNVNFIGAVFAISGTFATSYYYLFVGQKQKELNMNALQLLYHKSPLAVIGLFFLIPIFDDISALSHFNWTAASIRDIIVSCLLAVILNISTFATVGKTSALAFTIVGHLKTVGVFLFGYLIFSAAVTDKNLLGIFITLGGVVFYSYIKMKESRQQ